MFSSDISYSLLKRRRRGGSAGLSGCWMFVCLSSFLFPCQSEVHLFSSFLGETVCPDQRVMFFCNATGPPSDLVWSLDGDGLYAYLASDTELFQQNSMTTSVLLRNFTIPGSQQSQLIFDTLPSGPTFTVTCTFSRTPAMFTTTILREKPPAVSMRDITISGSVANVSWTPSSTPTLYYQVLVNGLFFSEVRSTHVVIPIDNAGGRNYTVEVIAVDICNNIGARAAMVITSNSTDSLVQQMVGDVAVQPMREEAIYKMVVTLVVLVVFMFAGQLSAILYCICSCFCGSNKCKDSNQCGSSKNKCKAKVFFWQGRTGNSEVQSNIEETKIPL